MKNGAIWPIRVKLSDYCVMPLVITHCNRPLVATVCYYGWLYEYFHLNEKNLQEVILRILSNIFTKCSRNLREKIQQQSGNIGEKVRSL